MKFTRLVILYRERPLCDHVDTKPMCFSFCRLEFDSAFRREVAPLLLVRLATLTTSVYRWYSTFATRRSIKSESLSRLTEELGSSEVLVEFISRRRLFLMFSRVVLGKVEMISSSSASTSLSSSLNFLDCSPLFAIGDVRASFKISGKRKSVPVEPETEPESELRA